MKNFVLWKACRLRIGLSMETFKNQQKEHVSCVEKKRKERLEAWRTKQEAVRGVLDWHFSKFVGPSLPL